MTTAALLLESDTLESSDGWSDPRPHETPDIHPPRSRRVLVVDDEPIVLLYVARLLEEAGYEVQTALNGVEALRTAEDHAFAFDLVITDIRMPALDGWELGRRLRQRRRSLPVLYVSGYDLEQSVAEPARFLRKPFEAADLLRRVADLVGDD
jgi:CheY-like chemotaxis protein